MRMQVQHGDPLMILTTNNPWPLAKVVAVNVIPRAQNPERVMSDHSFEH